MPSSSATSFSTRPERADYDHWEGSLITALKPLENRRVRGVASERYPLNEKCAHPECSEKAADPHHIFPRSQIGNDSWFVEIEDGEPDEVGSGDEWALLGGDGTIPHVSGLCRAHHDAVEMHQAWIKLEDGVFVWYDRHKSEDVWAKVGPLNPQPGSKEGKPKRRKFQGEARRKRATISIRVPNDSAEDGAGIYDELVEQAQEKLQRDMGVDYVPTPYITLVAVLHNYLTGGSDGST